MISRSTIDKIFSCIRVEEIISDFVVLKKAGSNFKGLSPFVDEKTPSFMVSPAKQIWKDFSSGKGGNAISFLMEIESYTYPEALRYVAKKYHIEIEEDEKEKSKEYLEEKQKSESLYQVSEFAGTFFKDQLLENEEGKSIGLSYFKERGFTSNTIEKFQLGYSPQQKNAFTRFALTKGYKKEVLEESGLSIFNNETEPSHGIDRFRERVIFPIFSYSGRILGFGGRILRNDVKTAKYLNSPESDIYHKSKILYGLYQSKKEIVKQDNCLLVEGYTDVISLHQNGIENVVASSGTSLTEDQIRLIKRLTKNITILFDGDAAGIKASFRGIDMILSQDMNVKIVLFPKEQDPDSFAHQHSEDEVKLFIKEKAKDFIQFKTSVLLEESQHDPVKKSNLIKEIIFSISLITSLIQREIYVKECSKLLEISERVLFKELAQISSSKEIQEYKNKKNAEEKLLRVEKEEPFEVNPILFLEEELIQLMLKYGSTIIELKQKEIMYETTVIEEIINQLHIDNLHFQHEFYNNIFKEIKKGFEQNELRLGDFFVNLLDEKTTQFAAGVLFDKYIISDNWKSKEIYVRPKEKEISKKVKESLLRYKWILLKGIIEESTLELKNEEEKRDENYKKIMRLIELRHKINIELNRVV